MQARIQKCSCELGNIPLLSLSRVFPVVRLCLHPCVVPDLNDRRDWSSERLGLAETASDGLRTIPRRLTRRSTPPGTSTDHAGPKAPPAAPTGLLHGREAAPFGLLQGMQYRAQRPGRTRARYLLISVGRYRSILPSRPSHELGYALWPKGASLGYCRLRPGCFVAGCGEAHARLCPGCCLYAQLNAIHRATSRCSYNALLCHHACNGDVMPLCIAYTPPPRQSVHPPVDFGVSVSEPSHMAHMRMLGCTCAVYDRVLRLDIFEVSNMWRSFTRWINADFTARCTSRRIAVVPAMRVDLPVV